MKKYRVIDHTKGQTWEFDFAHEARLKLMDLKIARPYSKLTYGINREYQNNEAYYRNK